MKPRTLHDDRISVKRVDDCIACIAAADSTTPPIMRQSPDMIFLPQLIGAFLIAAGNGPEKQELVRLIGTLVRGPDATRS
jgi:hypothetical protein